jgi:hypothetical protein
MLRVKCPTFIHEREKPSVVRDFNPRVLLTFPRLVSPGVVEHRQLRRVHIRTSEATATPASPVPQMPSVQITADSTKLMCHTVPFLPGRRGDATGTTHK